MYMLEVQLAYYGTYLFQSALQGPIFADKIAYYEYHIPYYTIRRWSSDQ